MDFHRRDLAVAILVERLQRFRRVLDFLLVNHAVVICVEHREERTRHRPHPRSARPAGASGATRTAGFIARRALTRSWRGLFILRGSDPR